MGGLGTRPGCDGWPGNEARVRWVAWEQGQGAMGGLGTRLEESDILGRHP